MMGQPPMPGMMPPQGAGMPGMGGPPNSLLQALLGQGDGMDQGDMDQLSMILPQSQQAGPLPGQMDSQMPPQMLLMLLQALMDQQGGMNGMQGAQPPGMPGMPGPMGSSPAGAMPGIPPGRAPASGGPY